MDNQIFPTMIARTSLRHIAWARLKDAEVLFNNRRTDGAIYLCGYAIELALKSRICKSLKWKEFPDTKKEFEGFESLRTHNLDVLLAFSGIEPKIKNNYMVEWSQVTGWNPELRYKPVGSAKRSDTRDMISSARTLLRAL